MTRNKMSISNNKQFNNGFVLPAIIALSLAIMISGVTVMQVIASTSRDLNAQYFTSVAKEAAEAGLVKGGRCVSSNQLSWASLTPDPNRECSDPTIATTPAFGPAATVMAQDNWRSTFSVTQDSSNIGPILYSEGTVYIYRNNTRTGPYIAKYTKKINSVLSSTGNPGNISASTSRSVTKVASGGDHSCALSGGEVYCWGKNADGQLGTANFVSSGDPLPVQRAWPANAKVTDVEVGAEVSCAIVELDNSPNQNQVWCWGKNDMGQLGIGSAGGNSNVPVRVQGLAGKRIVELAEGTFVTSAPACVLTDEVDDVNAYCWGGNSHAQIGNNTANTSPETTASRVQDPNNVFNGRQIVAISANNYSTCSATDDGAVYCWGWSVPRDEFSPCGFSLEFFGLNNAQGCPLTWTYPRVQIPASFFNNQPVTKLAAGGWTNCAIAGGDAYCWGNNVNGVLGLGNGNNTNTRRPNKVNGLPAGQPVTDIDVDSNTACAITGGQLYCWGYNQFGQLGIGSANGNAVNGVPRQVADTFQDKVVTSIGTGFRHECAVATGVVYCWGDDPNKLLIGNSTTSRSYVPVETSNPLLKSKYPAIGIAAGTRHTCSVLNDRVFCWGDNSYGQLGNGDTTARNVPEQVPGALSAMTASRITAGDDYSCASTTAADGYDQVYCWGRNDAGQLGNDTTTSPQTTPTLVKGLPNNIKVTGLSAGENSTCAIASKKVYCWGGNNYKQLGLSGGAANAARQLRATEVTALSSKVSTSISVGYYSACAVANTELWCWGRNYHGVIGVGDNDTDANIYTPTRVNAGVIGSKRVASVSVSKRIDDTNNDIDNGPFACAVLQAEKNTVCWGSSGSRQLGDGVQRTFNFIPFRLPFVSAAVNANSGALANQPVSTISVGGRHACSLSDNTTVVCWGNSTDGQIGNGNINNSSNPARINTYGDLVVGGASRYVTAIAAGDAHTCAIADSAIFCWGKNNKGQLGVGDNATYSTPKLITSYNTVNSSPLETGIRY
ncbi:hypothetical protein HY312_03790 [Candidatus Saccharibacteria bacterium]|nr:hypothetical protein [Candidatus Saccharibacteria bacterium]